MPKIEIFTKFMCPYCSRALALLKAKDVAVTEYDITMDSEMRQKMIARANGGTTVPQIFIDGKHVGGSDELAALERAGRLDPLLNAG